MEHSTAFISLGSNAPNAREMLARAEKCLEDLPEAEIAEKSGIYLTEPQDFTEQPWFLNQVLKMTVLKGISAPEFLKKLLAIEDALGRKRGCGPRFGPRLIDIDLLLFNNETRDAEDCILPHPRMTKRAFILWPLATLDSGLKIAGQTTGWWLERLDWKLEGSKIRQPAKGENGLCSNS